MKSIVIIPIYKESFTEFEKMSLVQCCKILGKHDFSLICPEDLEVEEYTKILNAFGVKYRIESFGKSFFESLRGYNLLMLSADFYTRFSPYEYMLIYQLDAYVFRDELNYWCEKGYDYIGAPWIGRLAFFRTGMNKLRPGENGGFSLRKVYSCIEVLGSNAGGAGILADYIKSGKNEDGFFSLRAVKINPAFKVAPLDVAIHFSFERKPETLFQITGGKLPFGCHAWAKYNPGFWKKFINS